MKLFNKITIALMALVPFLFASCVQEENTVAKAVLASASTLTFDGEAPEAQIITIYADADWTVVAPDWVTVDKMSGSRTMDVTVSVGANMREGALDNPRKAELIFKGSTLASQAVVMVYQTGDKFRDVENSTVSQVVAAEDETVVIVPAATVAAVTTKGYVITDGTANVFVEDEVGQVALGANISLCGDKETADGLPVIKNVEGLKVNSNETVVYPEPKDITAALDTYNATSREYVKVTGSLKGNKVNVEGAKFAAYILNPTAAIDLDALSGHNVELLGYFAGVAEPVINIMAAAVVDLGLPEGAQAIYFLDDFMWLKPWCELSGAGDFIGTGVSDATAPNVYSVDGLKEDFLNDMLAHGYADTYTPGEGLYIQGSDKSGYYLKLGKKNVHNGVKLAPLNLTSPTDIIVKFKWAAQYGGTYKLDPVTPCVMIEGAGKVLGGPNDKQSQGFETAQKSYPEGAESFTSADHFWNEASVTIQGADATTIIGFRPSNWQDGGSYLRWYLGGIEIVSAGAVTAAEPSLLFYDSFTGQTSNQQISTNGYIESFTGDGSDEVTYTAGNHCQFKTTYAQGTVNNSGTTYDQYNNALWPELGQGTPGVHLYPDQGTFVDGEVWFQINDIKLLGYKTVVLGMAIFCNGTEPQMANHEDVAKLIPLFYKFDNQTEWTKMDDVKYKYNWQWHTYPDIAVPDGAKKVSFRFEPVATNYFRVDDITVVGK